MCCRENRVGLGDSKWRGRRGAWSQVRGVPAVSALAWTWGGPLCVCARVRALNSLSKACEEQGRVSAATRMRLKPLLVLQMWACKHVWTLLTCFETWLFPLNSKEVSGFLICCCN